LIYSLIAYLSFS